MQQFSSSFIFMDFVTSLYFWQTVDVLIQLLELHLTVLGNEAEEDRVWDVILQGRARLEKYEQHIKVCTCCSIILLLYNKVEHNGFKFFPW